MDLGFERAGMRCAWQVEIDPFARRVLAKHWPNVRRHDDVKTFPPTAAGDWCADVICGGFPCQDISYAGLGAGIEGERSGLWSEIVRLVRVVRPRFVVVENVAALLDRGMGRVLGDLAACGFDAEWRVFRASDFALPHQRDRVFVVAYPIGFGRLAGEILASPASENIRSPCERMAYRPGAGQLVRTLRGRMRLMPDAGIQRMGHGLPGWVDRLRGCGNAIVPQIAEWIGRRIVAAVG